METKVRVGVRVRPLLPNERAVGSEMVVKYPGDKQIGMGERAFTYDHVFGPQVAQGKLYEMTARPMLKPFLEGYNVTIIAYGQTGSGKTYTMGSEATCDYGADGAGSTSSSSPQGLIPRFVEDLFAHLQQQQQQEGGGQQREANVTASFLEIYGEDVYDLLDDSADASAGVAVGRRVSLPIREDAAQGVIVSGLKQVPVASRAEALQVLRKGTTSRTTAATLMNVVSSRSHAVFTITLQQVINPTAAPAPAGSEGPGQPAAAASAAAAAAGGAAAGEEEGEGQVVVSKLTFVDLAGSERLKRTGAEGERRREGIQINVGLLALGSVINALADEERLAKGKRVHVPYRQSKLTRLLQDALGGNSQTLFLACVSPADINASETLSTLYYANRARNIRNKPVKNTDSVKEELRCLRQTAAFLKAEMVRLKFQGGSSGGSPDPTGQQHAELMERPEVKTFLEQLGARLDSHLRRVGIEGVDAPGLLLRPLAPATPGANRYSYGGFNAAWHQQQALGGSSSTAALLPAPASGAAAAAEAGSPRLPITQGMGTRLNFEAAAPTGGAGPEVNDAGPEEEEMEMVVGDPEKELAILEKLRELQQHEAQAGEEAARDQEALANVEGEMEQKEGLLEQLRQTLEGYHGMRGRYERLLKEVDALEGEKEDLHRQLEQAILAEQELQRQQQKQQQQPPRKGSGAGAGASGNPVAAAAASAVAASLREKLKGVEAQLDRLKVQKKQQENLQRLAERQRQELKALEENLSKLKATKAQLMKRQREAAKRHEQLVQQKRREVEALRKADRTLQKKMGRLELESRSHKVLLDRKDHCIRTLKEKAAKAETHVMRLLQLQNRSRDAAVTALHKRTSSAASGGGGGGTRATPHRRPPLGRAGRPGAADPAGGASASASAVNDEKVEAARFLLEKLVEERLAEVEARKLLEQKTRDYEALVTELRAQAAALERLRAEGGEEGEQEEVEEAIREAEARLEGLDVEMELVATAIAELQIRLEAAEQSQQPQHGAGTGSASSKKKAAAGSADGGGGGLSEDAALKAVAELGAGEARVLLAGLLDGMVDARARAWELETEAKRQKSAEEGLRLDKRRLERRLSESARGFEQRLTDLRSQHQKDLITLVRGVGAGEAGGGANGGGGKAQEKAKGGGERQEEEVAEAAADAADEVAKRQLEALAAQNEVLESRCQGLLMELDAKAAEAARLQQAADTAAREARELKAALDALKQAEGQEEEDAAAMEELLAAWGELGLSDEKRRGLLDCVTSAPRSACRRLLDDAKGQRDAARARVDALQLDVRVLAGALGLPTAAEGEEGEGEDGADLLALQERLEERAAELRAWVETRLEAAQRLAGEAQRLQGCLGPELEGGKGGASAGAGAERGGKRGGAAALAELQRLYEGMGWGEEDEAAPTTGPEEGKEDDGQAAAAATAIVAAARKVVRRTLPALSEAGLKRWEDAVKGLRVARADLVLQLQDMLERARGACALLGMDANGLTATLRAALAREARCPASGAGAGSSSSPLKSPRGGRRRSSISALPPGLRIDDAALQRMVGALTGPGVVAGLWAEEVGGGGGGGGATLREALPQARFIVEVGVECWNRRRELAGLCRAAAAGLAEAVAVAAEAGQGAEEDARVLRAGVEAVRAALPEQEEEEGEETVAGGSSSSSSSGTGMTEAEAEAFVGAVESLLASVEAQRGAAKAALEALWDYFKVPAEERNAGVLERQPTPPPAGEGKEKEGGEEDVEAGNALMRVKAAVERAQAPAKERGEIEAWLAAVLERLRQALQALQAGLETAAALRGQVGVLADKRRRQESILKLDRDIAALEAEFKAFEERAKKDKGRLTNRKATSVGLLKEEQFRKGSQARARSLLARLKQELTDWVAREGQPFDASLLGADLQQLFQVAQESGGDWERARTELMHLCTQAPLGPAGGKQRRRSSPTSQLSPEMPRVSPTASVDGSGSGSSGEGAEAPPTAPAAGAAAAGSTGSSSSGGGGGSSKPRDPFARVLSPTDGLGQSGTGASTGSSTRTSSSAATTAAVPVPGPGMAGFGLGRLATTGTLSDIMVRGVALPAAMAAAKDAAASKRDGAAGGGPTKENVAKNE